MQRRSAKKLIEVYGRAQVLDAVREEISKLREKIGKGMPETPDPEWEEIVKRPSESGAASEILQKMTQRLEESVRWNLKRRHSSRFHPVINATGTVLHTNLGRAPLSGEQTRRLAEKITGYSNLEYQLDAGCRGERYSHFEQMLVQLTGAEAAVAVNNNAAAVLLILGGLAAGKEVIVSRGEQIEIGGKFRIPEVIEQGGAILREVGTTNRTRREDYVRALSENTGAILKVHTSNYRITGFTESTPVSELTGLGVPVIEDLGSGVLVDLERFGMRHEPTVQESVKHGADLVCFSGDKLLGGPQAGIIVGKKELIEKIKKHPLMRAVRIDKFTAAALEMVLQEYLQNPESLEERIPVLHMLSLKEPELKHRAEALCGLVSRKLGTEGADWKLRVESCLSEAGGGSLPGEVLPGAALTIEGAADGARVETLQYRLRMGEIPVIGYIAHGRLWLDMRTVFEEELPVLAECLREALLGGISCRTDLRGCSTEN